MNFKLLNRRQFIKLGLGLSTGTYISGYAQNKRSNSNMTSGSNTNIEITDFRISVKGERDPKSINHSELKIGSIYSEVSFKNCIVEIVLNDIPIKRFIDDNITFETEHSTQYIIKGENKL